MITIKGKTMLIPTEERSVSVLGDEYSSRRVFAIKRFQPDMQDLSALIFRLDFRYSPTEKNTTILTKTVDDDKILLVWDIISNDLPYTGTIFIQVRGTDEQGTVKWRSFETAVYCEQGISSREGFTGSLSELERLENSVSKVIDSEERRKENEVSRQTNETGRQTAETARHEYFEEIQKTDVAKALLSEKERVEAENARKAAETIRQSEEAKRQGEESTRSQKETERITAESKRVIAEEGREAAKTNMVTATGTANTAADRANDAAQAAEDVVISKLHVATESTLGVVKSGGDITVGTDGNVTVNGRETPQGALEKAEAARVAAVQMTEEWAKGTFSNPNLLINGDFQVWQRGESITCAGGIQYTVDRWSMWTMETPLISKNIDGSLHWVCAGNDNLAQMMEGNYTNYNEVTLSVCAKANKPAEVGMRIFDATSVTVGTQLSRKDVTLSTEYKLFSMTVSIKNIINYIRVHLSCGSKSAEIDIKFIKLELGSVATPFVPRPYGKELALCQRYYLVGTCSFELPEASTYLLPCTNFVTEVRINPQLKISSQQNTKNKISYWASGTDAPVTVVTAVATVTGIFAIYLDVAVAAGKYVFNYIVDAEIY